MTMTEQNDVAVGYTIALEACSESLAEVETLYKQHYLEMCRRLEAEGLEVSVYNPRYDEYIRANEHGWLLHFVLRCDGEAVGYSNVYLTNDMHNGDLIAREDAIYVTPKHRHGIGKKMMKHIQSHLRARGVKRINITTSTDLRVSLLLRRMGYRATAFAMTLDLHQQENSNVRT